MQQRSGLVGARSGPSVLVVDASVLYDAAYVALAEALDTDLLTGDVRLAKTPGPRCRIETLR